MKESDKPFDVAFLDVEMPGMTGLELAEELQKKQSNITIVFVTAFPQYALDAYKLLASDYCLKPLSVEAVKKTMENLRYSIEDKEQEIEKKEKKFSVICFGDFNIFDKEGNPVIFKREKAKELLAYLISKNGVPASSTEICDALWGDMTGNIQNYFWKVTSELRKTLKDIGGEDILVQGRRQYYIDTSKIDCDYMLYLEGKYDKEWNEKFMEQYGMWAEMIKAGLVRKLFF